MCYGEEGEEGTHWLPKRENVTTPSINAATGLSSVEFTWKAKQELCLLFLSVGFPSTPLTESKDTEAIGGKAELAQTTAPDRFLVTQRGRQWLIHFLKNCTIRLSMNRFIRFGDVKRNTTSKLCKHIYRTLKLAIRKLFTASWRKYTLMYLRRVGKRLTTTDDWAIILHGADVSCF